MTDQQPTRAPRRLAEAIARATSAAVRDMQVQPSVHCRVQAL